MFGAKGLIFVVFLCEKNGIIVLSFSGRMSHRHLAMSSTSYDIGIEKQKDNPMLKTHKIALDPNNSVFPSSKACSACGIVDSDLSLSDRTYHCSACGHTQDRDLNAAINLKNLAVGHTESINACGDSVRPQQLGHESSNQEDSTEQPLLFSLS